MVYLYYDNPDMLRIQLACWNTYVGVLQEPPEILLIDDGSPKTSAAEIVKNTGCKLSIKIFRITEDIPWNFSGARNLGCAHADSWIYVSDIDTVLPAEDAKRFFEEKPLNEHFFYMPRRVWLPDSREAAPAIVNLLFHKKRYLEIGGYDEDYAGHYGREETDFYNRLKRVTEKTYREDVVVTAISVTLIADACTALTQPRDKTVNARLYTQKEAAGFPAPVNPLRFSWEQVL